MLAEILGCVLSAMLFGLLVRSIVQASMRGWLLGGELRLIDRNEEPQAFRARLAWRAAFAALAFLFLFYFSMAALVAGGIYRLEL
jgi:hypothetical protein